MNSPASSPPRERVNITYTAATGGLAEERELPFKLLAVGSFSGRSGGPPIEDRMPMPVTREGFDEVLDAHQPVLDCCVPNELDGGGSLALSLRFRRLADFEPEAVARQTPELRALLELREALAALKGPLGNLPAFRKAIQSIIQDPARRAALEAEIGLAAKPGAEP